MDKELPLDQKKYILPNNGYDLLKALKDLCGRRKIAQPAFFFTSLPLGAEAVGKIPEEFYYDDCIGESISTVRAIISTYWWEREFANLPIVKFVLMMLSQYMLWLRIGDMPHDDVVARGCLYDYNNDVVSVTKCFDGNGLCLDCWRKFDSKIDKHEYSIFEAAAALRMFNKAADRKICFVAMPFNKEMNPVFDLVSETLKEAGWSTLRADKMHYLKNITDAILFGICVADRVIADLTGKNANVSYELGFAKALSTDTFLMSQDELPFDLKDKRACLYGPPDRPDLKKLEIHLREEFQ